MAWRDNTSIRTPKQSWQGLVAPEDVDDADVIISRYRSQVVRSQASAAAARWDADRGELPAVPLSAETLNVVREGFVQLATLADRFALTSIPAARMSDEDLALFVNEQMRKAFSAAADVYSAYDFPNRVVGRHSGFTDEFDLLVQERIPARPKAFATLSVSLCADYLENLRRGGAYVRPWGALKLNGEALVMVMPPRAPYQVRRGRRARLVG